MKLPVLTFIFSILISSTAFLQITDAFNYQAAIRNSSGELITNQNITVRISIRDITANGTI